VQTGEAMLFERTLPGEKLFLRQLVERQASSTVMPPLRMAASTAALRRITHLLVFDVAVAR